MTLEEDACCRKMSKQKKLKRQLKCTMYENDEYSLQKLLLLLRLLSTTTITVRAHQARCMQGYAGYARGWEAEEDMKYDDFGGVGAGMSGM